VALAQVEAARDVADLAVRHLTLPMRIEDLADTLAVALDEPEMVLLPRSL
jgi:hypothetical protein